MDTHMTDSENPRVVPAPQGRYSGVALVAVLFAGLAGGALLMRGMGLAGSAEPPAPPAEVRKDPATAPGTIDIGETAQRNAGVQIVTAESAVLPATIEVTGVVAPDEKRLSHIRPIARGLIEDVTVSASTQASRY
jgi:multidrug efflux pump subunit AcrA (membrane-fusion protein)